MKTGERKERFLRVRESSTEYLTKVLERFVTKDEQRFGLRTGRVIKSFEGYRKVY